MVALCDNFKLSIPTIVDTQFLRADGTINLAGDLLIAGTTELQFERTSTRIYSSSAFLLDLDAFSVITLRTNTVSRMSVDTAGIDVVNLCKAETFESDVATGTAPFTVASTTLVANLNVANAANAANADDADKVDGLHVATSGSALADMSAENSWSGHQLFGVGKELRFADSTSYLRSSVAGQLITNAGSLLFLNVGGSTKLLVTSASIVGTVFFQAINFISTVATGTKPYACTSTTLNNNLNADLLDGKEAAELNPTTTKGDLIGYDTAEARIPVGANGDFLQAQSGEALGVKWSPAAGGGDVAAGAVMTDHSIVRGDGGSKGVQDSAILIDDSDNVTGVTTLAVDVAGGTAPFTITSGTVVANLNVDQVDGKEAAELNPTTTKGDLVGYDTGEARIPVGTNDQVLTADSAQSLGVKWATPSGGSGSSLTVSTTTVFSGTSPTSMTNLDLSGTVGSNVALVALSFKSAADMNALAVRTDGDANEYYAQNADANSYGVQLGHADDAADLVLIVATNSSGIIEWRTEVALTCTVDILWYIA